MDEQSISLLKECSSGCKMASGSIRQVREYAKNDKLERILDSYDKKHKSLGKETTQLLEKYGKQEEEPGVMADLWAKMDIEMKMLINGNHHQIAKLMMDGCNMGIQTISEKINQYAEASKESIDVAQKLVKIEEDFMKEMKEFV
jgi:Tfp pilus assembly pilus retraction ATPase PilT